MSTTEHDDLQELIGAFVLHALDPLEQRRVERHVSECAECAREVRLLSEAAAELAWLPPAEEGDDVVDRVLTALPRRPRRLIGTRIAVGVAAVATVVAGFLGAALVHQRAQNAQLAAITASAARRVPLAPQRGFAGHGTVYVDGRRIAIVLDHLPAAGGGRAYQLWALTGAKPASMAVIDSRGRIVRTLSWNGSADKFAVTIEPAGGSPVPTSEPVLES